MSQGIDAGLVLIARLDAEFEDYYLIPAARADLLRRAGRSSEAALACEKALQLVKNAKSAALWNAASPAFQKAGRSKGLASKDVVPKVIAALPVTTRPLGFRRRCSSDPGLLRISQSASRFTERTTVGPKFRHRVRVP